MPFLLYPCDPAHAVGSTDGPLVRKLLEQASSPNGPFSRAASRQPVHGSRVSFLATSTRCSLKNQDLLTIDVCTVVP